jgi:hypothetical protein
VSFGALIFLAESRGVSLPELTGWKSVFAILIGSYVSGLLCFAAGRWLRMGERKGKDENDLDDRFRNILTAHGLTEIDVFKDYLERKPRGIWRLYIRLWAEARHSKELSPSLLHLNRYWVMAATYDGLTVALIPCIVVVESEFARLAKVSLWPAVAGGTALVVILILLMLACSREAGRYFEYQVEELVAAIVAQRERSRASHPSRESN